MGEMIPITDEDVQEIWDRMNNPKTVEDYGLSLSLDDLKRIPEGRRVLAELPTQGIGDLPTSSTQTDTRK